MIQLPRRSRSRVTKAGMIYERRIIALRRLQSRAPRPEPHHPAPDEIEDSVRRWGFLRHNLP